MKVKLALAILIISLLLVVVSLAEDVTTSISTPNTGVVDADEDGVVDTYDACLNTPLNALLIQKTTEVINYLGENINRNGCTCTQIRAKYDFASNPCALFECYQDSIFVLSNKPYNGGVITCPEDTCDTTTYTYYDYPLSGYPRCDQFNFIDYDCTPTITKNATQCGYVSETNSITDNSGTDTVTGDGTVNSSTTTTTTNITAPNVPTTVIVNDSTLTATISTNTTTTAIVPVSTSTTTNITATTHVATNSDATNTATTTSTTPFRTQDEFIIPELLGSFKKSVQIEQSEIRFAYPLISEAENEARFEILLVGITNPWPTLDYDLYVDKLPITEVVKTDRNDNGTNLYLLDVLLLPNNIGEHTIEIQVFNGKEKVYSFERTYVVRVSQVNIPIVPETKIVVTRADGELDAEDYAFAKAIHDELIAQYATDRNFEEFNKDIVEATKKLRINKEQSHTEEDNTTTFIVRIEPKKNEILYNVTIIEYIPKEIVKSAQNITFTIQPKKILADDPLIMWHFAAVDERIDLEYKVSGNIQATGNTIATLEAGQGTTTPWHIIIPVVIIPLLILLLVIFPHMHRHEHTGNRKQKTGK